MIVSHELPSIFAIADRTVVLDAAAKTMVALGPPQELRDSCPNDWVRSFFKRQPPAADQQVNAGVAATRPNGAGERG